MNPSNSRLAGFLRSAFCVLSIINFMKKALFLAAILSLFACSPAPAQSGNEVAAKVGNRSITTKELDDRWSKDDPVNHAETTQKLYDGRRAALDSIIAETVIADAAKAKGMTAEAFESAEVGKRLKPVTDADVTAFYQQNVNQMQGRSLDVMSPAINRFLTEQRREEARQALITELRKTGPAVSMLFDAPRRTVEIESSDPTSGSKSAPITLIGCCTTAVAVMLPEFDCAVASGATPATSATNANGCISPCFIVSALPLRLRRLPEFRRLTRQAPCLPVSRFLRTVIFFDT